MYRLFVAIDFPEAVKEELARMCFGIPGARWVLPEQLHLTLRFVGEVDGGVFRDIMEALHDVKSKPLSLQLKGVGCFPPGKMPRVLWVGVEKNDQLTVLRNRVESAVLRTGGVEPEKRKFAPHITLARLSGTPLPRLMHFLAGNNLYAAAPFEATSFQLYESTLTSQGAIHTIRESYPIGD